MSYTYITSVLSDGVSGIRLLDDVEQFEYDLFLFSEHTLLNKYQKFVPIYDRILSTLSMGQYHKFLPIYNRILSNLGK
jgi:hypothetical protein